MSKINIGKLGENLVARRFCDNGYSIVARNYRKKYGEIDIVCSKRLGEGVISEIIFVEVKAKISSKIRPSRHAEQKFRLEEKIDARKLQRLKRVVSVFLSERGYCDCPINFTVALVEISFSGSHRITLLRNLPM